MDQWFRAAQKGDLTYLQQHHDKVHSTNYKNWTALMCAAEYKQDFVYEFLTEEAGYSSPLNESAIFMAISSEDLNLLKVVAPREYGLQNQKMQTPIMAAIDKQWVTGVQTLISYYRTRDSVLDEFKGITPLIRAIQIQNQQLCQMLAVTETNWMDCNDRLPVHYAVTLPNEEIMRTVSVGIKSGQQLLLIDMCQHAKNLRCVKYLQQFYGQMNKFQQTSLMFLCMRKNLHKLQSGEVDAIQSLVQREQSIHDQFGKTALMYAAETGSVQMIEILIQKEQKQVDMHGNTALMHAIVNQQLEAVKLLAPIEKDMQNSQDTTALKLAIIMHNELNTKLSQQYFKPDLVVRNKIITVLSEVESKQGDNSAIEHAIIKNDLQNIQVMHKQLNQLTDRQKEMIFELSHKKTTLNHLKTVMDKGTLKRIKDRHLSWDEL